MATKFTKVLTRAYLGLVCVAAPLAIVQAQTGTAGSGQAPGTATGNGSAGTVNGTPGTNPASVGATSTANGAIAGQGDYAQGASTQGQNNNRGHGNSGWFGLLGLLGLLGLRRRDTDHTTTRVNEAPTYETADARRP